MKPKEKAVELIDKMQNVIIDVYSDQFEKSKACAIIAVNEILNCIQEDHNEFDGALCDEIDAESYWNEVKQEIEKL